MHPAWQLIAVLSVQLLVLMLVTGSGVAPHLALLYPLSAASFGLFFSRVRAFCEHVSLERQDGECPVRSHSPNMVDRLFFYSLNMNLHVEHHLFPQVPARNLPVVHRALKEHGYLTPSMTSPAIATTVFRLLRAAARRRRALPAC